MDFGTIEALKDLVGIDKNEDDDGHIYGSAINPGTLNGKKKEEMAKPNAKIEVKTFNRDAKGGAPIDSLKQYEEEQKKKKEKEDKTSIWTEEEVNIKAEEQPDDRPQPKFDVLMK
jgi:predicted RNA-binding protein with RPS1 domain